MFCSVSGSCGNLLPLKTTKAHSSSSSSSVSFSWKQLQSSYIFSLSTFWIMKIHICWMGYTHIYMLWYLPVYYTVYCISYIYIYTHTYLCSGISVDHQWSFPNEFSNLKVWIHNYKVTSFYWKIRPSLAFTFKNYIAKEDDNYDDGGDTYLYFCWNDTKQDSMRILKTKIWKDELL